MTLQKKESKMNKKLIFVMTVVFAIAACTSGQDGGENIIKDFLKNPATLIIDVRTPAEYQGGHLDNAVLIPHTVIAEQIAQYTTNPEQPILAYCRSGNRSGMAKNTLKAMGYTNVVNGGAYLTLKKLQDQLYLEAEESGQHAPENDAAGDEADGATGDATCDSTADATGDSTADATDGAIGDATGDSAADATDGATGDATDDSTGDATDDSTADATDDADRCCG